MSFAACSAVQRLFSFQQHNSDITWPVTDLFGDCCAGLVGMLSGCFLAPATFQMFVAGQPALGEPGSVYPPFAQVYP